MGIVPYAGVPESPVEEVPPPPPPPPLLPPVIRVNAPPVEEEEEDRVQEVIETTAQGMVEDILKKALGKAGRRPKHITVKSVQLK